MQGAQYNIKSSTALNIHWFMEIKGLLCQIKPIVFLIISWRWLLVQAQVLDGQPHPVWRHWKTRTFTWKSNWILESSYRRYASSGLPRHWYRNCDRCLSLLKCRALVKTYATSCYASPILYLQAHIYEKACAWVHWHFGYYDVIEKGSRYGFPFFNWDMILENIWKWIKHLSIPLVNKTEWAKF